MTDSATHRTIKTAIREKARNSPVATSLEIGE
jgi:hypothetical protein